MTGAAVDAAINRLSTSTVTTVSADSRLSVPTSSAESGTFVGTSVGTPVAISSLESVFMPMTGPQRATGTKSPAEISCSSCVTAVSSTYAGMVTRRTTEPGRTSKSRSEEETPSVAAMHLIAAALSPSVHASINPPIVSCSVRGSPMAVGEIGGADSSADGIDDGADIMMGALVSLGAKILHSGIIRPPYLQRFLWLYATRTSVQEPE